MSELPHVHVLGISAAHRPNRNTAYLVQYGLDQVRKFGERISDVARLTTDYVDLAKETIQPACSARKGISCATPSRVEELYENAADCMRWLFPKLIEADAYIFGSAVFTSSFTSRFAQLLERMQPAVPFGVFTRKPFATVTAATMLIGGQETTLQHMNDILQSFEMLPVSWPIGSPGVSGPPYGQSIYEDDGSSIGVANDRYALWLARSNARRAAEWALYVKLGREELGELFEREFISSYTTRLAALAPAP